MQGRVDAIGAGRLGNAGDAQDAELLPVLEAMFEHLSRSVSLNSPSTVLYSR